MSESGMLVWMLMAFGALVLVFQAIPSVIMFGSMLKGLLPIKEAERKAL